jgi:anti-sigma B factor antagonist
MNGSTMEFTITELQNCVVIKISGRIDSYTSPKIKQKIQSLIKERRHNFVIDMSDVTYLSSSGILLFVNLQRHLTEQYLGKIVFSEVHDLIYSSFELAGFNTLFEFYKDKNIAVRRF